MFTIKGVFFISAKEKRGRLVALFRSGLWKLISEDVFSSKHNDFAEF